ncbi:MAG: HNH endonuclease, partial [Clostridiales bacterium]|nr:HNH endonuclease [Clostridiales bacterium]
YSFVYLDEHGMDISYQIMIYNSNKEAYEKLLKQLPSLFKKFGYENEYLSKKEVSDLEKECRKYYDKVDFPAYDAEDVIHIIEYYALKEAVPEFYGFDEIDRNRLDVAKIAQRIYDEEMVPRAQASYLDSVWDSTNDNIIRMFFGRKLYFLRHVEIELGKLMYPEEYASDPNVAYGTKDLVDLPLSEIEKHDPELARKLRDEAFNDAKNADGLYVCKLCGKTGKTRRGFQVDHIVPMNKGGKSVSSNLQILCSVCNSKKGDK